MNTIPFSYHTLQQQQKTVNHDVFLPFSSYSVVIGILFPNRLPKETWKKNDTQENPFSYYIFIDIVSGEKVCFCGWWFIDNDYYFFEIEEESIQKDIEWCGQND